MIRVKDVHDAGVLLGFALQPKKRPTPGGEYRRALDRYRTESDFREAVDALMDGLDMRVIADSDYGLMLGVQPESPFAFRMQDLPNIAEPNLRLVAGLVVMGLAAYAYPTQQALDEQIARTVQRIEFEAWLRRACQRLADEEANGQPQPDDRLDRAYRTYLDMPAVTTGGHGRGKNRLIRDCTTYWVNKITGWLIDQGMAQEATTGTGVQAINLTERFRVHVAHMASESAYLTLARLRADDQPTEGDAA